MKYQILVVFVMIFFASTNMAFAQIGGPVCDPENPEECLADEPTFVINEIYFRDDVLIHSFLFFFIPIPIIVFLIKNRKKIYVAGPCGVIGTTLLLLPAMFQTEPLYSYHLVAPFWVVSLLFIVGITPAAVLLFLGLHFLDEAPIEPK